MWIPARQIGQPVFIEIKLRYKYAIKEAITSADKNFNENLANQLYKKDFQSLWK